MLDRREEGEGGRGRTLNRDLGEAPAGGARGRVATAGGLGEAEEEVIELQLGGGDGAGAEALSAHEPPVRLLGSCRGRDGGCAALG